MAADTPFVRVLLYKDMHSSLLQSSSLSSPMCHFNTQTDVGFFISLKMGATSLFGFLLWLDVSCNVTLEAQKSHFGY